MDKVEVVKFDEISFVTDEEVLNSNEYKKIFKELKEELNDKKIKTIFNNIEKISIEDTVIYNIKNETEFDAFRKYYIEECGMKIQNDWQIDFSCDKVILVDNSVDDFVHTYVGKEVEELKHNAQRLIDFIGEEK